MKEFPYITDKEYPYLVSIAIPTRKRIHSGSLLKSLDSIVENTKDKSSVQVVIRADNDDTETLDNMDKIEKYEEYFDMKIIVDDRWGGYKDLDKILNQCFDESDGEFFLVLTDDCVVDTENWDGILKEHSGKISVIEQSFQESDCRDGKDSTMRKPSIRKIPWIWDGNHGCRHAIQLTHRVIPEILGYFNIHTSGDRQYDMITTLQPSLLIKEMRMMFTHYIQPAEHVKEGVVTHPDGILNLKDLLEHDCQRLVTELKKTYGNAQ